MQMLVQEATEIKQPLNDLAALFLQMTLKPQAVVLLKLRRPGAMRLWDNRWERRGAPCVLLPAV